MSSRLKESCKIPQPCNPAAGRAGLLAGPGGGPARAAPRGRHTRANPPELGKLRVRVYTNLLLYGLLDWAATSELEC